MVSLPGRGEVRLIVMTRPRGLSIVCGTGLPPGVFPSYSLVLIALCVEGLPRVCLS